MVYALLLNFAIIGMVCFELYTTKNGLALLGLFFLQSMPFGLLQQESDDGDDGKNAIGFIQPDR